MNQRTDIGTGLTRAQVARAEKNIPAHHVSDIELALQVLARQFFSFFFALLIVSGVLSLVLHQTVDSIIFFSIACINAIIGFFQEFRASKSTQALEKLITHTVTVRRDGQLQKISSYDVVFGDIVIGEPGDVIVADMIVRESRDLFIDESVRTGETLPKSFNEGENLFAGASIVQGNLIGEVIAVGKQSSILMYADKIAKVAKNNNFEQFIQSVSKYILVLTTICLALVFVLNVLVAHSILVSEYVLYGISMLVGVVPESLPLVVTIILTREALSLARSNVIIKKLSALQNLGSMNYLFTDKTGTITENNLKVSRVVDMNSLDTILDTVSQGSYERTPMDAVFDQAIDGYLKGRGRALQKPQDLKLSPFQIARGFSAYTLSDGTEIIRGQYSRICISCDKTDAGFQAECLDAEQQGLRVIAFARKEAGDHVYCLSGAIFFEDPLKNDASHLYRSLKELNVDVKIVTGDSVAVAEYVGHKLDDKIDNKSVFSMDYWRSVGTDAIENYSVYARCKPEQKSELIDEHLDHGVVGFVGEGINDALALKRADIGFVVNNASDVARQSGDVILLEKSLSPIISAVIMSRKAFAHIRTYLLCTLAGNIGTLISLTAVVLVWQQIPMLPIQILLNNLLTDVPLMFLIADTVSSEVIKNPIRDQARKFFKYIVVFALVSSVFDFIFFFAFQGYDIALLRTGWFVFSVIAELTLVFSLRSEISFFKAPKISKVLLSVLGICYVVAIGLPYMGFGSLFHLVPLSLVQLGILIGITIVYFGVNEGIKKLMFQRERI
jgi:Mg2+-importing ATPase